MTRTVKASMSAAAVLAAVLAATAAGAHTEKPRPAGSPQQPATAPLAAPDTKGGGTRDPQAYFTDLELQTQDGRKVRFYSDMLQGRTVLLNVIYTSCPDACPLITQHLNEVRRRLPELFGKQVHFVTLTSDPRRDTPQALKQFAQKQGVDVEGWTFLTGSKQNLEQVLKRLGMYAEQAEGHSTLLIGGNVGAKRWSKIRPDAPPVAIAERLRMLAGDPGQPVATEVPPPRP